MDDLRFLDPEALVNRAAFNERFGLLNAAALYKTITPTAQLGTLAEGSIIYLNENGQPVPFYVAKQGYEPNYNTDRVLVVRKDVEQQGVWSSVNSATYGGSTIDNWFNQTYLQTLDSDVQEAIGTTNIPYTPSLEDQTLQRTDKKIFALSLTEYGGTPDQNEGNVLGTVLPTASLIKNDSSTWTRTIRRSMAAAYIASSSTYGSTALTTKNYYQPAFTLPTTFIAYTSEPTTGLYDLSNNLLLTLPGVQIETGSYVGTGTYGSGYPNSLTFGFKPKMVIVSSDSLINGIGYMAIFINPSHYGCAYYPSSSTEGQVLSGFLLDCIWDSTKLSYYTDGLNSYAQLNIDGIPYNYLAIG